MLLARLMQMAHRRQQSPSPSGLAKLAHSCRAACFASEEERSGAVRGRAGVQAAELSGSFSKHLQCLSLAFPRSTAALQR